MEIERLTETEEGILEALAVYRYLIPRQMLKLEVCKAGSHLYATLRKLVRRKPRLIVMLDFGVIAGEGRLPRFLSGGRRVTREGVSLSLGRLVTRESLGCCLSAWPGGTGRLCGLRPGCSLGR